ncbi:hypothetical protein RJ639_023458 [Escallonia herrerae]|uniref:Shugoshin C-terminal domain-containing protein n=1 Tax=Escallonia herrerae TaxID=1293975 RepID=A0AA88V279_9ASTE|nr:hypothetical protein RJ639_023458 [Escallonia herrerae]
MAKMSSFGNIARRGLSDITNSLTQPKSPVHTEKPLPIDLSFQNYIDSLLKELNLGKDKLKELRHELGCKEALLKAMNVELQEIYVKTWWKQFEMQYASFAVWLGRCLRRQSARLKSHQQEPKENLFELEDVNFPVSRQLGYSMHEEGTSVCSSIEEPEKVENRARRSKSQESQRRSYGRPSRKAAEKVQSYKEVPINTKMRRED